MKFIKIFSFFMKFEYFFIFLMMFLAKNTTSMHSDATTDESYDSLFRNFQNIEE